MNAKIAIITGLIIACTSVSHAQDNPENGRSLHEAIIPAVPVIYEPGGATNAVIFMVPLDPSFSAWAKVRSNADGIEHDSMNSEYPFLFLPRQTAPVFRDDEREIPSAVDPVTTPSIFPDPALRHWLKEAASHKNEPVTEAGTSNRIQVIFIEPLNAAGIDFPADVVRPEYGFKFDQAQPAWFEWINPKLVLAQWVDFWTNETNATPVVLVLFTF